MAQRVMPSLIVFLCCSVSCKGARGEIDAGNLLPVVESLRELEFDEVLAVNTRFGMRFCRPYEGWCFRREPAAELLGDFVVGSASPATLERMRGNGFKYVNVFGSDGGYLGRLLADGGFVRPLPADPHGASRDCESALRNFKEPMASALRSLSSDCVKDGGAQR